MCLNLKIKKKKRKVIQWRSYQNKGNAEEIFLLFCFQSELQKHLTLHRYLIRAHLQQQSSSLSIVLWSRLKPSETKTVLSTYVNRSCSQISKIHGKLSLNKNCRTKSITCKVIPHLWRRPEHSFMSKTETNALTQLQPLTRRKTIICALIYAMHY